MVLVVVEALVIAVLADVGLIVVRDIVIPLKLVVSVSYNVGVPAARDFDLLMDAATGAMLGVLPEVGIEMLADVNANAFAVLITAFEFPVSTPLEELSR